jgi:Flp pilus assembly protein TadG
MVRNTRLSRLLHSKEGNIAIITALMMPCIVGFCGLATEVAYWYYRHRDIQAAADIAAFGATIVLRKGGDESDVEAEAKAHAVTNGWRQANGTIAVNTPPTSGAHQDNLSVEVLLTENQQRYFSRYFFGNTTAPISVRAVGTYASSGPACFLSLHPTASHAMEYWGNSTATFQACNIVANSIDDEALAVGGTAEIVVPCAQVAGGAEVLASLTLTDCEMVTEGAEPTPDPYKNLPEPPINNCQAAPNPLPNPLPGGCYNGLTLQGNVTLSPNSIYVINGGSLKINANANVTGTNVMFFLTNNAILDFAGNAHVNLSAPNSGTYSGILLYGDRDNGYMDNKLQGDAGSVFTGAAYFPTGKVTFTGSYSGVNGCMQVVASMIHYTGDGSFSTNCAGTGLHQIPTPGIISLAE